jgi:predicted amidophosphoribosyltransferase
VRAAFSVKTRDAIAGRRILLVDDVYTSGATVNECSRVLKTSGAKAVYVLTLARAVG